ncbi:hypothetical protein [Rossellomorea vietnamensis]|nr:hypothetical protein [Rossellomorea vietnamensis]
MIFIIIILIIFLYDFTKMVKQNDTLIEQNKEIISRLDDIKNK